MGQIIRPSEEEIKEIVATRTPQHKIEPSPDTLMEMVQSLLIQFKDVALTVTDMPIDENRKIQNIRIAENNDVLVSLVFERNVGVTKIIMPTSLVLH